jgi:thioredoxin-related protein
MKKISYLVIAALAFSILQAFIYFPASPEIGINTPIPEASYKMKSVTGNEVSLNDVKTKLGLLVIFSCNTCPYVKLSESRILELNNYCRKNGIGCILVNSNEAQRTEDDCFDEMTKYYQKQNLSCPYVVDLNSKLANAFGATRTPQCFLFDSKGLVYKGAIDDNVKEVAAVKSNYVKDALDALLKNETPKIQETKSIGCSIKRND